jgi:hypothetical protein
MLKRLARVVLAGLVLNFVCSAPVLAHGGQDKEAKRIAKVKKEIAELGTGPKAKVEVKLRDKTKRTGYVSAIGDEQFAVTDEKTNTATNVSYAQVEKVTPKPKLLNAVNDLRNTGTFKTIGFVVGLSSLAVLVFCLASRRCEE